MTNVYVGIRGPGSATLVKKNDQVLYPDRSLKIRRITEIGFDWGWGGCGAAQLALAVLLEECPPVVALGLYQQFKVDVIKNLPRLSFRLTSEDIQRWLNRPEAARAAAAP